MHSEEFEHLYQRQQDPWRFASSAYEQEKYSTTLEWLRKSHYVSGFEPGCAEGVLTARLAPYCDHLVAMDISPTATDRARHRCAELSNVEVRTGDFARAPPFEQFDLIVFSELGYYFPKTTLAQLATSIAQRMQPGGEFIAVHWLGSSEDHVLTGDEVHEALLTSLPLAWARGERRSGYRIDQWIWP